MVTKKSTGSVTQTGKAFKASRKTKGKIADRYNEGKARFDLIPPYPLEELALVYTHGAQKYADNNWLQGMDYNDIEASLWRHLHAWRSGQTHDLGPKGSGLHHMAHVAWNALTLIEYERRYPNHDSRTHWWLNPLRIGFDIDGVLADFVSGFKAELNDRGYDADSLRFGTHWRSNFFNFKEVFDAIADDGDWWFNLKPLVDGPSFPFQPVVYITQRRISSEVTMRWLERYGFPVAAVETTGSSKAKYVEEYNLDVFIDDKFEHFQEINADTTCVCYLMDAPHNRKFPVGDLRISSLEDLAQRLYSNDPRTLISSAES